MWDRLRQFLAAPVFADDENKTRAAAILNPLLISIFVVVLVSVLATVFVFAQKLGAGIGTALIFAIVVAAKLALQSGHIRAAGWIFIIGSWIPICTIFLLADQWNLMGVAMLSFTVIAGLVLGYRAALLLAAASSLAPLVALIAASLGYALPNLFPSPPLANWVIFTFSLIITVVALNLALRNLNEALKRAHAYAAEVEQQRQSLKVLAEERAVELNRRTSYLGAATEIATEIVAVGRELQALLDRVVEVVSQQFGFYHTGIFLLDARGEWVVLRAASSAGGRQMLQQGYRQRVGVEGIVGAVAAHGQYRIAQDVGADAVYLEAPELPDTRSEIALPLRVRDEIIGVLDVQSKAAAAFSDEDVHVLQALADQVSVAVNNARLLRQVEESIAAERRAYGQMAREAWQNLLRARLDLGFASDARGVVSFNAWEPQMKAAAQTGQVVSAENGVAIPLQVREQVIGVIDGRKPDGTTWSAEEINLLQTLTEQLGGALESARLYEDTQRRAARERVVSEVTARIRETLDIETVLKTAADEMRQALELPEVSVRLMQLDE